MKKSIKKSIIFMTGLFMFMGASNAATIVVANGEAQAGDKKNSVDISLKDSDVSLYSKLEFELTLTGTTNADLAEFSLQPGLEFKNLGNNKYMISKTGGFEEGKIGTIYFVTDDELSENFTISPVNTFFYKDNDEKIKATDAKAGTIKYIKPARSDAYLTSLEVSQGTLTPEFNKDTLEYEVNVPESVSIIKITANPAPGAIREGSGNKALQLGENNIEITVTAEDKKTTRTYKIKVMRGDSSEPSAYLKDLKIKNEGSKLTPDFDSKNNKYSVSVPFGTEKLDLEYELEDKTAEIKISGNENFKAGENKVTIEVTSTLLEETQKYEITVNVEEKKVVATNKDDENKEEVKHAPKKLIIALIAVIIVLIVSIVSVLLFRKKKNNRIVPLKKDDEPKSTPDYVEEKTTTYDLDSFREVESNIDNEDEDKTKEFHF